MLGQLVDDARFAEARKAYDAGDFRTAAKEFLASAGHGTDGNGAAYHMAGNALVRLRRFADAVTVYGHALEDELYEKHGSVLANRASAQAALGDYTDAIASFEQGLEDPGYKTPYRALQGMAGALLEMGRTEEAAAAYRRAALDEANPNPGAALVNLGLCFMALGRPEDAAEAYQAALGFDAYSGRGKALANLGQAYFALSRSDDAVRSFDKAVNLHGHTLSPAAMAAYQESLVATQPQNETVDGWLTGEMPPVFDAETPDSTAEWEVEAPDPAAAWDAETPDPTVGWDTGALAALGESADFEGEDALSAPVDISALGGVGAGVVDDDAEVLAFLNRTDDEMRERDRELRRAQRAERRSGRSVWKPLLIVGAGVLLLVAMLAVLYFSGYGWPTQGQTTRALLSAQKDGRATTAYWVAVPERDVRKEMAKIPPLTSFSVDSVDRGSTTSTASVTVTPNGGAPLHYQITMQREGVGWKVTGIENDWQSTDSGS